MAELARFYGRRHGDVVLLMSDGQMVRPLGADEDPEPLSRFSARWLERPEEMIRIALATLGEDYSRGDTR